VASTFSPCRENGRGTEELPMTDLTSLLPQQLVLAIWGVGMPEMIVIAIIVLLLFGNRLPSVMKSLGQSITEFKKGTREGVNDSDADKPI